MKSITFTCEVITPMFLAGADGVTPELRPPSIKGALRFWWRALNGHLELKMLKEREGFIFGSAEKGRSKVIIRVEQQPADTSIEPLVPHKPFMKREAFQVNSTCKVMLSLTKEMDYFNKEHLKNLFEITTILGGFGKRVRRGMGAVHIVGCSEKDSQYPVKIDLPYIYKLIATFSSFYVWSNNKIYFNYSGRSPKYGYIIEIQLGKPNRNILSKISNTTHEVKRKDKYQYEPSLGHAYKGRFASPVYVSVVKGSTKPIITTLNTAPDKNEHKVSLLLQEEFKNRIL